MRDLIFLHGFLGCPEDGNFLNSLSDKFKIHLLDYTKHEKLSPDQSLESWGQTFQNILSNYNNPLVIGYSQGGRLALHAFIIKSFDFVIVSSSWGPFETEDRILRWDRDQNWANKFLNESWDQVISEWNSQEVFNVNHQRQSKEPLRAEKNYDRKLLTKCILNWSLSKQKDLSSFKDCYGWSYIVGQEDKKYFNRALGLLNKEQQKNLFVAPDSGHRVIFDNPDFIINFIQAKY